MREKLERIRDMANELLAELEGVRGEADFSTLKGLLESDDWPMAVAPVQMVDDRSEAEKTERAEGICEILLPPLVGLKFLDFGCGEGHVAKFASDVASMSVGYDPKRPDSSPFEWESEVSGSLVTADFTKVQAMAPYDVVLIYDVLDHCEGDPAEALIRAKSVLAEDGRIHLRCHPWTGRHGGHAYRKMNKAFAHLVFTEAELRVMGVELPNSKRFLYPIVAYDQAIDAAGLKSLSPAEVDIQEVEGFFRETPAVRDRILGLWGLSAWSDNPPEFQMSQCFVDYVLKKDEVGPFRV